VPVRENNELNLARVIPSADSMVLWLTTLHENGCVVPLLDKEGPGVVDRWATAPYPLLLRRRGAIFMTVAHTRLLTGAQKP
jgi:hypothetical protein